MSRIMLVLSCALFIPQNASAQTTPVPKVFVTINGAYQMTTNDFSQSVAKHENAEDGRIDSTYEVKGGPALSIGGGAMLWRRFGVGVGFSRFSVDTPGSVTATIPHPFFFNRARTVGGAISSLTREESTIHVQATALAPIGTRIAAALFGGPSFFRLRQGLVADVTYADSYPYDDATFGGATPTAATSSKIGFNVGGDLAFFFSRQLGFGGGLQFSRATLSVANGSDETDVKAGGLMFKAGMRLRF